MTYEEAKRILHPDTTREALAVIEFKGKEKSREAVDEACLMACEALDKQIPRKPVGTYTDYRCGVCGTRVRSGKGSSSFTKDTVCRKCFTVIDWSDGNGGA